MLNLACLLWVSSLKPKSIYHVTFIISNLSISASITIPTTLALGTSLECTLCTEELCGPDVELKPKDYATNVYWPKKYCTHESGDVDHILLFYPLILLIFPTIIYFSEKGFKVQ